MVIDFDSIQEVRNEHFKGGEGAALIRTCTDGVHKVMRIRLEAGSSIGMHTHQGACEMYIVLSGKGRIIYEGETYTILPGQAHYCPEGKQHTLINDGPEDLVIFAVVPNLH